MVRSTQKEIRQRAPLWLVVLLVLNFGLMSWRAKDSETGQPVIKSWAQSLFSPVQSATTGVGGAGVGFFRGLSEMRGAQAENEGLRRRLAEAETELREARQARDENERLKRLLDFTKDVTYQSVPARIIARDPSVWFNSLIINRGSTSGVDLDMPVVTPEGIVGRVVGVGPVSAQVMLITDERSAAGAVVGQLGQSNAIGSVRGYGKNGPERRHRGRSRPGLGHHAAHDQGQAGRAARLAPGGRGPELPRAAAHSARTDAAERRQGEGEVSGFQF
jgi:rod shape-determining protein MreC